MIKLIAETAWHHEGDFDFMKSLIIDICKKSTADIVKLHITLNMSEYMTTDHDAYEVVKGWVLTENQWKFIVDIVRSYDKQLMLLLNDTKAIEFAKQLKPEYVELHSVCLNVPRLQKSILDNISSNTSIVIGVGGTTIEEIDHAVSIFNKRNVILMFGFQNYPTEYENVNLSKIRKIQSLYPYLQFGYADHTAWNEDNNELITLLIASNGMHFIEKHVTNVYGTERCDYSAAISITMLNNLYKKLDLINALSSSGSLLLNDGEREYSKYGPMKMAAVLKMDKNNGDFIKKGDFDFIRCYQESDISQIDIIHIIKKPLKISIQKGTTLCKEMFRLS